MDNLRTILTDWFGLSPEDDDEDYSDLVATLGLFHVKVVTHSFTYVVTEWEALGLCDLDYSHAKWEHARKDECIAWEAGMARSPVAGHDVHTPLDMPRVTLYLDHSCDEWVVAEGSDVNGARSFAVGAVEAAALYARVVALVTD